MCHQKDYFSILMMGVYHLDGLEMGAMTKPSLATHPKKETVLLKGNSIKVIADNYNAGWHPLNYGVYV